MSTKSIYKSGYGERVIAEFYDSILAYWPVPCQMLDIPTRHGNTFVVASGSPAAPALVQLHGSSTNSAMWSGDVSTYSRHYRVYTVDTLGEPGKSAPSRPSLAGPAYAEWLEDVFNALNIQKAVLMGYSQGGWMALKFATYRPERLLPLFTANILAGAGHVLLDTTGQILPFLAGTTSPLPDSSPMAADNGLPGRAQGEVDKPGSLGRPAPGENNG